MSRKKHIIMETAQRYTEYRMPDGALICVTPRKTFDAALEAAKKMLLSRATPST